MPTAFRSRSFLIARVLQTTFLPLAEGGRGEVGPLAIAPHPNLLPRGEKGLWRHALRIVGHQPLHRTADGRSLERQFTRFDQVTNHLTGRPWPNHANRQSVSPGERPLRCAGKDEVAVGTNVSVLNERLHDIEKRDVVRPTRIVILDTKQLPNANLDRVTGSNVLFQCTQVARHAVAVSIVFVGDLPAMTHVPAIDPVLIPLAFVERLVIQHPLDLRERTGSVVLEEAEVRLRGQRSAMRVGMMMGHQPGKGVALAGIGLLKVQRLFVVASDQEQAEVSSLPSGFRGCCDRPVCYFQVLALFQGQLPFTHEFPPRRTLIHRPLSGAFADRQLLAKSQILCDQPEARHHHGSQKQEHRLQHTHVPTMIHHEKKRSQVHHLGISIDLTP